VAAVLLAAAVAALLVVWRPWDPVPDALRAAARDAAEVPGVVSADVISYEVTQRDAKDGDTARASVDVVLDEDLAPGAAQQAAERADAALAAARVDGVRDLSRTTTVHAGRPSAVHGVPVYPVTAWVDEDGDAAGVADAFRLRLAGATRVSGASADAADGDALVALARACEDAGLAASLATADGAVRYDTSGRVPDPSLTRLAVEVSARPGVTTVVVQAGAGPEDAVVTDGDTILGLQVGLTGPTTSPEARALVRWLDDPARPTDDAPLAYTITEPGYATSLGGWVAASAPPEAEKHTVPLPEGVRAWPDDGAPACTGADLELALGTPDAAAGSRYLAVLARNTSGRPCALDGVPSLEFRNAAGEPQRDVTLEPSAPGVVPGRVVVPPGERALATVQWGAMSTANDPDVTTTVDVAPVPGAEPVPLTPVFPDDPPSAGGALDVLDGADVRVGPWVQGAEGITAP